MLSGLFRRRQASPSPSRRARQPVPGLAFQSYNVAASVVTRSADTQDRLARKPSTVSVSAETTDTPTSSDTNVLEQLRALMPPNGLDTAAQAVKIVFDVLKPLPWLGPAADLCGSILFLCQRVSHNRKAATGLAFRCVALLQDVNEISVGLSDGATKSRLQDLTILLQRLLTKMDEWRTLSFLRMLLNQEQISDGIKSFHVEIDQFCQRYAIVAQTVAIAWMEEHEKQCKEDMDEMREFFAASESRQKLQYACNVEIRDNVKEILGFVQRLAFDSAWKHEQRLVLRDNFAAMCKSTGELPPDVELHEDFLERPEFPIRGNGTFDIYRGSCAGYSCAIKVLRRMAYNDATKRRFGRQFRLWREVYARDRGNHILPLIGAVYRPDPPDPFLCFVSPWMEKGNALDFVRSRESVDRIKLIRGIAEGLNVLHSHDPPLLHGYLKCSNVLINDFGEPLLADFGLLRIIEEDKFHVTSCPDAAAACRWLPLEMIRESDAGLEPTAKADVFMFGMTVLEIMTEKWPFAHVKRNTEVAFRRAQGELPRRPVGEALERGLDDHLWSLLQKCWSGEPSDRPTIAQLIQMLPPPRH